MIKSALITGAGKGLGLALCKRFTEDGYRVYAVDKELTDDILSARDQLDELYAYTLDVTDYDGIKKLRCIIEDHFGRLDIIINNAGIWLDKERNTIESPGFENDIENCYIEFDVNAMGTLKIVRQFLPLLKKSAGENKTIINISSDCSSYNSETNPRGSEYGYCMSKACVNVISNLLANSLKEKNIKVFSVFPGWMQTDMGFAGVVDGGTHPDVSPDEAARYIIKLVEGKPKEYTYCNRFGQRLK